MKYNKSGFSLVELMVVVSIIAILASIAVPNFSKMSARAKQTSARVELSGIYTAEQAFFAEYSEYHPNLSYVGYVPDGWAMTNGCPDVAGAQNTRYYSVGFPSAAGGTAAGQVDYVPTGAPAVSCAGLADGHNYYSKTVPTPSGVTFNFGAAPAADTLTGVAFTAVASGIINPSGARTDVWSINETKRIANDQSGI